MNENLEALAVEWRQQATNSRFEAERIRQTIKSPTDAEERCFVRAGVWDKCANQLLDAIRAHQPAEPSVDFLAFRARRYQSAIAATADLRAKVERLEGELATAHFWRERHGKDADAYGQQSNDHWLKWQAAESNIAALQSQLADSQENLTAAGHKIHVLKERLNVAEQMAREVLAAKGEEERPLPDSVGWWWEATPSGKNWSMMEVAKDGQDGKPVQWIAGCWRTCQSGRWVKALPPAAEARRIVEALAEARK